MSDSTSAGIYGELIPALAKFKRGEGTFDDVIEAAWEAKKQLDFWEGDLDLDEDCKTLGWASECPECRTSVYKDERHYAADCLGVRIDHLREFTRLLIEAPDHQLDQPFRDKCGEFFDREWDGQDHYIGRNDVVRFLRDLRDQCVFTGQGSLIVMSISAVLDSNGFAEENPEEAKARRSDLEQRWSK